MSKESTQIPEFSLFLPAYNEETVIQETIKAADKVLQQVAQKYEIVVVEDGSRDKTGEKVEELAKKNKNIRLIRHKVNRGYGGAIKTGFYSCKYQWIGFTDSDGQFDFAEIRNFIPLMDKNDLIIGYRLKRQEGPKRWLMAFIWKMWNFFLFGLWVRDIDCAFKVFNKKVFEEIPTLATESAETTAELLIRCQRKGFKIGQVGVTHLPRKGGKSTGDNVKVIIKALRESLNLWYVLNLQD